MAEIHQRVQYDLGTGLFNWKVTDVKSGNVVTVIMKAENFLMTMEYLNLVRDSYLQAMEGLEIE